MKSKKKLLLSASAVLLLVGGLWLTVFNGWTFIQGYSLGGGGGQQEVSAESKDRSAETKAASSEKQVADADAPLYPTRPKIGNEIGELSIPKLAAVLPIFHGTDEDELAKGVGHYADSVLPGEKDNAVLSGHRDTVFRKLGDVGVGDELIVTTSAGEFTYKVRKVRIVDADDRTVIVPKPRATLTVSTCYPFDFIGAAPERYILEAYLVK